MASFVPSATGLTESILTVVRNQLHRSTQPSIRTGWVNQVVPASSWV